MIHILITRAYEYYAKFGRFPCVLGVTQEQMDALIREYKAMGAYRSVNEPIPDKPLIMGIPLEIVEVEE